MMDKTRHGSESENTENREGTLHLRTGPGKNADLDFVRKLIGRSDWSSLREYVGRWPVAEMADVLSELDKPERVLLFRVLPRNAATEVFAYLDASDQDELLKELTDEETRHIMANLAPDDRTELLEELPAEVTARLLNLLQPDDLREARWLLGYPEKSIGRLMTPDYVSVSPRWTVGQTLEHVRKQGQDSETVDMVYVRDDRGVLVGAVSLRQLVLDSPDTLISEMMITSIVSVRAHDDREKASEIMERYGLWVLPVTDSQGALVGIVTGDDILEIITDETTEDFHKGAGVTPTRVSLSDASPLLLFKSRVGWILGLVLVDLLPSRIIASYESVIAKAVSLVFFLPLIMDSAGNAGSQSAVLMVRALAVGDVTVKDWTEVLLKELGVSVILGTLMALVVSALTAFSVGLGIALVVGVALALTVVISSVSGAGIPFLASRFGLDPASASAPVVTSIADVFGVLIYFFTARLFLGL